MKIIAHIHNSDDESVYLKDINTEVNHQEYDPQQNAKNVIKFIIQHLPSSTVDIVTSVIASQIVMFLSSYRGVNVPHDIIKSHIDIALYNFTQEESK